MITVLFLYRPIAWCFLREMKYLSILMVGVALATSGVADDKAEIERLKKEIEALKAKQEIHRLRKELAELKAPVGLTVSQGQVNFRNGLAYLVNQDNPFTGSIVNYHKGTRQYRIKAPYVNGKQHGTKIWYNKDGSKESEISYVNGKIHHGTEMVDYPDGSKRSETPYVDGKKHGTSIRYNRDGSKGAEIPYVDGERHGTQITYWDDGSKFSETPYVDGKKHGTSITYWDDGSKWVETVYENGEKISYKVF